jgi:hypothetical protein
VIVVVEELLAGGLLDGQRLDPHPDVLDDDAVLDPVSGEPGRG